MRGNWTHGQSITQYSTSAFLGRANRVDCSLERAARRPDSESCRSVFLGILASLMTRRGPVRCGKWRSDVYRIRPLRLWDSCLRQKAIKELGPNFGPKLRNTG